MKTAIDYEKYFTDRTIIISGVGRSGTTIFGKLIGSMEPAIYLFEPAIMKYAPMLWGSRVNSFYYETLQKSIFLGTLFEDYILPIVQGRSLNNNEKDWSYWGNYYENRPNISTRDFALEWFETVKPWIIIKTNESQNYFEIFNRIFPNCHFVHVVRDGIDVVASSLGRGWFADDYKPIEFADNEAPLYIPKYLRGQWQFYSPATRAAQTWRCLMDAGDLFFDNKDGDCWRVRYDHFVQIPEFYVACAEENYTGLKWNDLTEKHIRDIYDFKSKSVNRNAVLNLIEQPERGKFEKAMEKYRYSL